MKFESFEEQKFWIQVYLAFAPRVHAGETFDPSVPQEIVAAVLEEPIVQADLAVMRYRARVGNPQPATGRQRVDDNCCQQFSERGLQCPNSQVEGFAYCKVHLPAKLDEAFLTAPGRTVKTTKEELGIHTHGLGRGEKQ